MFWIVIRWTAATAAALLGFIAGVVIISMAWRQLGGDATHFYMLAVAIGTVLGVSLGVLTVPRYHQKVAFFAFSGSIAALVIALLMIDAMKGESLKLHLLDVAGTFLGGSVAYRILRMRWRLIA